ncbi:NAD(P)-binding protein [Karstenula rhodostoma CBS 690.94]|uniref:NAD(P)-binding protein n=1 Tax=Karstenula rhodostoma CBS 690.94 TaxID=1392251 RepID=A0A9P4UC70_9PLEO|nr:NAD(P)-binding protein [Karstenula rhodostoma CBS 690.94]
MSKATVLISGLNGYIAAVTAKQLLDNGYHVRGTVRKSSSATPLVEGPLKAYAESGALSVVEVPDITVPGAFDEAVKGVTAIAHLASPVSFSFTDPEPVLKAAVSGTTTILNSALKAGPQLKTILLLSSIVAIMSGDQPPYTFTEKDWNNWAEPIVAEKGKETPGVVTYCASKAASEKVFWKFRDDNKPSFTLTSLNPVYVVGPPLIAPKTPADIGETLGAIWNIFRGGDLPTEGLIIGLGTVVDVRDVAAQIEHIIAHPEETNGERYLTSAGFSTAQATADILRKAFPEARERIKEGTPGQGYNSDFTLADKTKARDADGSKAKKLLKGGEYIPYDRSVIDTAKSLAHLV